MLMNQTVQFSVIVNEPWELVVALVARLRLEIETMAPSGRTWVWRTLSDDFCTSCGGDNPICHCQDDS